MVGRSLKRGEPKTCAACKRELGATFVEVRDVRLHYGPGVDARPSLKYVKRGKATTFCTDCAPRS